MNVGPALSRKFQAIWNRVANTHAEREITPALIKDWASSHGVDDAITEDAKVGRFTEIPVVILRIADVRAIFPKVPFKLDPAWRSRRQAFDNRAALWAKVEWFCPLWEWATLATCRRYPPRVRQAGDRAFQYHTSTLYTLSFQAICIAQILAQAPSLKEPVPLAKEAYLAFYSG